MCVDYYLGNYFLNKARLSSQHAGDLETLEKHSFRALPSFICHSFSECMLLPSFFISVIMITEIQGLRIVVRLSIKKINPLFGIFNL